MVNVDTVYQRVLAITNKEQRGYVTPQEFNLLANQAQMMIFEQYFYDLGKFLMEAGVSTTHADIVNMLEEKISIFEVTAILNLTINPNGVAGNLNTLPRFYRLSNVRSDNLMMENVSRKDFRTFPNSPLTAPTSTRPIYMVDTANNTLQIAGSVFTSVDVDFIQSPTRVVWGYVITPPPTGGQGEAMYNASASQNFDLHPSEEGLLVIKILELAGITINKLGLAQTASNEETEIITQQKLKQ